MPGLIRSTPNIACSFPLRSHFWLLHLLPCPGSAVPAVAFSSCHLALPAVFAAPAVAALRCFLLLLCSLSVRACFFLCFRSPAAMSAAAAVDPAVATVSHVLCSWERRPWRPASPSCSAQATPAEIAPALPPLLLSLCFFAFHPHCCF